MTSKNKRISLKGIFQIILILILGATVLAACIVAVIKYQNVEAAKREQKDRISAAEKIVKEKDKWKSDAFITPTSGSLKAAGYITIEWKSAKNMGKVEGYKLYIDNEKVAETDSKTTSFEYYTTKKQSHEIYVEADMQYGSVVYSDIYTFFVNKKGFCLNKDMSMNVTATDWGTSWYYNWDMTPFNYDSFQEMEFVPMMWSSFPGDKDQIAVFPKMGYKSVLAFNEPDREDQANLDVDTAVEGMKAFQNKGIRVGAPATSLCPPWSDNWFVPFMKKMEEQNMDVDFIPIHHYWNWYADEGAQAFLDLVDETWEMYHKPIWITEFAISGDPGKTKFQRKVVMRYMKKVIAGLDKRDYVERYAWFSFSPTDYKNGGSGLLNHYEGKITDLGYLYQKLGMPKGYDRNNPVKAKANTKEDVIKKYYITVK